MAGKLFAIMNKDGEFVVGGTSNAKRNSKKPHVYTSHRNAVLGLRHVEQKEGEELEIVPFVSMDDFMMLAKLCEDMFPYAGTETDADMFIKTIGKYGYGLSEDGVVCLLEDL